MLKDKDGYQTILENLTSDIAELEVNPQVRSHYYHDAQRTLSDLEKLAIEPKGFPVAEIRNIDVIQPTRFITNDEIDSFLIGSNNVSERKMRILSHFLHQRTPKENVTFLKNEYGQSGGGWGNIDGSQYEIKPSKGIRLKRSDCDDANIRWNSISKRIDELIKSGRYASQSELDLIPQYEKIILARQINSFFRELPDEERYHSPFPKELNFYYLGQAEFEVLDIFMENVPTAEGTRPINNCLEKMKYIFDNTSTGDRYYNFRKRVIEDLTAFREGKYTLFPNIDRIKSVNKQSANNSISSNAMSLSAIFPDTFSVPSQSKQMNLFENMSFPQLPSVNEQQMLETESAMDEVTKADDEILAETTEETTNRFEVSITSDAYDESEPFAIWDHETESNYIDEYGDIPTFDTEEEAQEFLVKLQNKHAKIETLQDEQSTAPPTQTTYTSSWDEFIDIFRSDPDNVANYTDPLVFIENSESPLFADKERMTFADADQKIKLAEAAVWTEREERLRGYDKTNVTIFYKDTPDDKELSTYSLRYDLGDYQGEQSGLYNFLKRYRGYVEEAFNRGDGIAKAMNVTPESIASGKRMLEILEKSLNPEKTIDAESTEVVQLKFNMPVTKAVIDTFAGESELLYAKADEGSVYISNSFYIMKIAETDLPHLVKQVNRHRRKNLIEPTETSMILKHLNKAKGNFELTSTPYEMETSQSNKAKALIYADNKQYFCYDKQFIELFQTDNEFQANFFVNDHSSYDVKNHSLIVKDRHGGIIGLIPPVRVQERLYTQLADILPLEILYKNEIERARENPTHDPYIGREFFDGKETHFISSIVSLKGEDKYLVPNIIYGKDGQQPSLTRYALYVDKSDMDNQIKWWENSRIGIEQETVINTERAKQEAVKRMIYENTNGYADNFPQLQKARALKIPNDDFHTKDYGSISLKAFVETVIKNSGSLKSVAQMKNKYYEMSVNEYFDEVSGISGGSRYDIEMRSNYIKANHTHDPESTNAQWLKTNHPFLHYNIFRDQSVLDHTFFNTEYRLYLNDTEFHTISKTAYDYGNYLIDKKKKHAMNYQIEVMLFLMN